AEKAIDWAEDACRKAGAPRIWRQPVQVPVWHRGQLSLEVRAPTTKGEWVPVRALALGNSEGTAGQSLQGPLRVVESYEAFLALPDSLIEGHWIFFNHPFPQELVNTFKAYGKS